MTDTAEREPPSAPSVPSPPPVPTAGDEAQRRAALRRMKLTATAMLGVATILYLVAKQMGGEGGWGYLRAFAEAAMVGGLADWFAVTALFRHPMGLPIPHTAIIPERKDDIGKGLGEFVQGNFLTAEVLEPKLASIDAAGAVGRWMVDPANAAKFGANLGAVVAGMGAVLSDEDMQDALGKTVLDQMRQIETSKLAGRSLAVLLNSGQHESMFDAALRGASRFLHDNETLLRQKLAAESPWWVPESIDDRIFRKILTGVEGYLAEVLANPRHELRRGVEKRLAELAERLQHDPDLAIKATEMRDDMLSREEVRQWARSLWQSLKESLRESAERPDSELRQRVEMAVQLFGARLQHDAEFAEKVNSWVRRGIVYVAAEYRHEAADLISSTVAAWDATEASERIEVQVGRDLQFIRINGTVVGGLAGLVIHAASQTLF